jgi:hypothetical protein
MKHRDGCLKKSRLFKRSSFDKRWLKYTVRIEDCTYLCFLDDYRVCVKKRNFYRPPLQLRTWRKVVRSGAPRRRLSHWSTRSLHWRRREARIGGDVGSCVKYANAAAYDDWREEKKKISSRLLQAFRRPSQYILITSKHGMFESFPTCSQQLLRNPSFRSNSSKPSF